MKFLRLVPLALAAISAGAWAQGDPNTNAKIIEEGKNHNHAMQTLHYLTKNIGARLTSSPELGSACDWTADVFKSYGLKNVHLEKWGEFPVGFERRKSTGHIVAPYESEIIFTTPAWTAGTDGPLRGPAVYEPTTMEEFNANKDKYKGAWLIMKTAVFRRRPTDAEAQPTDLEKAIAGSGFAGKVYKSRNELVVTGGNYRITWDKLPTERRITVRLSDWNAIASNLDKGKPVSLEFNLDHRFIKGPVPVYNVVADLPGTEKPDEYVIVSGHLDSWNGPGSEGAIDNGTGTTVTMETARILTRIGAKPKRTIRFILWSGEEEGLLGSRAYIKAHPELLPKISAVFVDDEGTNYQAGVSATAAMEPMLTQADSPMNSVFPDMPFKVSVREHIPIGDGSDHDSFNQVGVPGFFWHLEGRHDYTFIHHTQHDVYEQAIPEYMVQKCTNSAVMAYNIACADQMVPRDPDAALGQMRRRGGGGGTPTTPTAGARPGGGGG
jgi:hypothetical protein